MLRNTENTAVRSFKILFIFVLRAEIFTIFDANIVPFPRVIKIYKKLANFTGLYFSYFPTFCNQTLKFY